ncbi:MAG: ribonuclease III [Anaerolineae bacterium]|nr:ribonuclease III [Anaerolineae bacterium]
MEIPQGAQKVESPRLLAQRLNLPFPNDLLLHRALTHRSYINEYLDVLNDNERLEFLGDAVLDFLVAAWLYQKFPDMPEGQLTRMRSALVRTEQLAVFASKIDLGSAMLLGRGEADSGGRQRPALLCAVFEALIGAIYLDIGLPAVRKFIEPFLESVADKIVTSGALQDPKSRLQEWAQAQGYGAPSYHTVATQGPDHDKVFEVEVEINGQIYGRASGHSKQAAAKAAASQVLIAWQVP